MVQQVLFLLVTTFLVCIRRKKIWVTGKYLIGIIIFSSSSILCSQCCCYTVEYRRQNVLFEFTVLRQIAQQQHISLTLRLKWMTLDNITTVQAGLCYLSRSILVSFPYKQRSGLFLRSSSSLAIMALASLLPSLKRGVIEYIWLNQWICGRSQITGICFLFLFWTSDAKNGFDLYSGVASLAQENPR